MGAFFRAALYVLNVASILAWVASVAFSDDHHPLNFWAVIALTFLALTALVWGFDQRREPGGGGGVHHYHAPVVQLGSPLGGQPRAPVGPATPTGDKRERVRLADYVELPDDGPPVIRNRDFRNAVLIGPIVLGMGGSGQFVGVTFGVAEDGIDTILFELEPNVKKAGIVGLENCSLINCTTEHVAFAGTKEQLDGFRAEMLNT